MRISMDQAKEFVRKGLLPQSAISGIQTESSPSPPPSPEPSKTSSTTNSENKLEKQVRRILEVKYRMVEREKIKIRIGPENQRCWYTPDLVMVDSHGLVICEIKGPFEHEDSRVKRMACADWCRKVGLRFLFVKQRHDKLIQYTWM